MTLPRIFVEDWNADYGSPYQIGASEDDEATAVLVEDGGELRMHEPGDDVPSAESVAFVDGVRRGEGWLYQENPETGEGVRGLAGAFACGVVLGRVGERPEFGEALVRRLVIWGSGKTGRLPPGDGGWEWEPASTSDPAPDAPLRELQRRMRQAEAEIAESVAQREILTICDGPLRYLHNFDLPVVGYIKSHYRRLLPLDLHPEVPRLRSGQRTSIFSLGSDRYSCYTRIAEGHSMASPWSGIVRLEVPQSSGQENARRLIDQATRLLPRYAGWPHRDPRAPQNLQPIHALENHLRQLFGASGLASRAVREAVGALHGETT